MLRRIPYLIYGLAVLTLFIISRQLDPSPSGIGTHRQLGLPQCGFYALSSIPCPSCGLTTSFVHMSKGNFKRAMVTQPFGFLLYLAMAFLLVMSIYWLIKGTSIALLVDSSLARMSFKVGLWAILVAWIYKILAVKLLGHGG